MNHQLMQGCCLERMKEIPDGSVDMILCDLPYGTTQNKWDSVIPLEPLWREYRRIGKLNAAIVLTAMIAGLVGPWLNMPVSEAYAVVAFVIGMLGNQWLEIIDNIKTRIINAPITKDKQ